MTDRWQVLFLMCNYNALYMGCPFVFSLSFFVDRQEGEVYQPTSLVAEPIPSGGPAGRLWRDEKSCLTAADGTVYCRFCFGSALGWSIFEN